MSSKTDDRFVTLSNGKRGGFKPGVQNGPEARTARGKRRANARKGDLKQAA